MTLCSCSERITVMARGGIEGSNQWQEETRGTRVLARKDSSPLTEYVLRGDYNQSSSTRMSTAALFYGFLRSPYRTGPLILFPHSSINAGVQAHFAVSLISRFGSLQRLSIFGGFPSILRKWH